MEDGDSGIDLTMGTSSDSVTPESSIAKIDNDFDVNIII